MNDVIDQDGIRLQLILSRGQTMLSVLEPEHANEEPTTTMLTVDRSSNGEVLLYHREDNIPAGLCQESGTLVELLETPGSALLPFPPSLFQSWLHLAASPQLSSSYLCDELQALAKKEPSEASDTDFESLRAWARLIEVPFPVTHHPSHEVAHSCPSRSLASL